MKRPAPSAQLGFSDLLAATDEVNRKQRASKAFERETGHLPGTMDAAIPHHRRLIYTFNAAVLADDLATVKAARAEAYALATKLNGGRPGILADDDAPGSVLDRANAAPDGQVPLWGQRGVFPLPAFNAAVHLDGMFGLSSSFRPVPGFSVRAIDTSAPFLSETGYRSFLGVNEDVPRDHAPDQFIALVLRAHVVHGLKGKLKAVLPEYRKG